MAVRRSTDPGVLSLEVYTADLCNLDPERFTIVDVLNALDAIGLEERSEGESAWPEVGKIISRVRLCRSRRKTEEERAEQARRLPETTGGYTLEDDDPEVKAAIARLNRKLGIN